MADGKDIVNANTTHYNPEEYRALGAQLITNIAQAANLTLDQLADRAISKRLRYPQTWHSLSTGSKIPALSTFRAAAFEACRITDIDPRSLTTLRQQHPNLANQLQRFLNAPIPSKAKSSDAKLEKKRNLTPKPNQNPETLRPAAAYIVQELMKLEGVKDAAEMAELSTHLGLKDKEIWQNILDCSEAGERSLCKQAVQEACDIANVDPKTPDISFGVNHTLAMAITNFWQIPVSLQQPEKARRARQYRNLHPTASKKQFAPS